MCSRIVTVLFTAFFCMAALGAEENPPKSEDAKTQVKPSETQKPKAEAKNDALGDFEKQLQKELEGAPDRAANAGEQPSALWQFVRTLITLAILLAIFYGVFRLYKFKRELPAQNFNAVSSVYEYPLGTNQRLQIVEIAGRLMILGVSEQSIQLLSEITDKYTIDRIKLDCAEDKKAPRADFLTELSRAIKTNLKDRFGKSNSQRFDVAASDDLDAQRQNSLAKLRRLKSEKIDWRDKA